MFGAGAQIDVAGLVASTLSFSNADFLAGRLRFTETPGAGSVVNQGAITTPSGGQVYLIAPTVENHGIITSPQGEVILAAGRSVALVDAGTPNLRVEITAPDNQALNVGQIVANSGRIGIYAGLIRNSGSIRADGVVVGANGEILLKSTKNVTLDPGSVVSASGAAGGSIAIAAQTGIARIDGRLEATGSSGAGGNIDIRGAQVSVAPGAIVTASGTADGGTITLVASATPADPARPALLNIETGARISATATQTGSGGVIDARADKIQIGAPVMAMAVPDATQITTELSANGVESGGTISLHAAQDLELGADVVVRAIGARGGAVEMRAETGTVLGAADISVFGSDGRGGLVHLLGNQVAIVGRRRIDAGGRMGGGEILMGGDYQGKNTEIQNASRTYLSSDAQLDASAVDEGNGGKVIIWSDDGTQAYGTIRVRGGAFSGNGGFVEASGKAWLDFRASMDASAPNGATGTLLLDPKVIDVNDTGGVAYSSGVNNLFANNPTGTTTLLASGAGSISLQVANVLLQANTDITFSSPVNIVNAGTTLSAQAGRSIIVNANVATTNADIKLTANETTANGVVGANRDPGAGGISMAPGVTLNAGTGNIFLEVGQGTGHAGATTASNIVFENLTAANISIINDNLNSGSNILRGSASSLLSATNAVFMELEFAPGVTDSIGTAAAPIRIDTPVLEAHYHNAGGGIFISSPNARDLQIGGVPNAIFSGGIRGVQTDSGGPIQITVNGNLSQLAGGAPCGFLAGGSGGPICAHGSGGTTGADSVVLRANDMNLLKPVRGWDISLLPNAGGTLTLGSAGAGGSLHVSQAEINLVSPFFLHVGENASGNIIFAGDLTIPTLLDIRTGGSITSGANTLTVGSTGTGNTDLHAQTGIQLNVKAATLSALNSGASGNINIVETGAAGTTLTLDSSDVPESLRNDAPGGNISLQSVNRSIAVSNVVTGSGDITLAAGLDLTVSNNIIGTGVGGKTLTVQANNNVIFNSSADVSTTNALNVVLNSDRDASGAGNIQIGAGSSITSNGGNITLGGGVAPLTTAAVGSGTASFAQKSGIYLDNANLNSGAGNISLRGRGIVGTVQGFGIFSFGGTDIVASGGTIAITGTGGAGTSDNYGVYVNGVGTTVQSTNGSIALTGTGGAGTTFSNLGVYVADGANIIATGSAAITLLGNAAGLTNNNVGVYLSDFSTPGTLIQSNSGNISITGTGAGSGSTDYGIRILDGARILTTGSAAISLDGTGAAGNAGIISEKFNRPAAITTIGGAASTGNILLRSQSGTGIQSDAVIQTSNVVTLNAAGGGGVNQAAAGSILSDGLRVLGSGTFTLTSASNNVASLAANVTGSINYRDTNAMAIGSVTSFDGTGATSTSGVTVGTLTLNAGGGASTVTVNSGSALAAAGSITGSLSNQGTVRPGGAGVVGTLNVTGNYTQSSTATLEVDIPSAASRDLLAVTNNATLDGTLAATVGYTPASGDTHTLLTASAVSGTFASITGGAGMAPRYNAGNFQLFMPNVISWDGGGDGVLWSDRFNWSTDQVPGAADVARIPELSGGTQVNIQLGAAPQTVSSVTFDGNDALSISTASLTFANASSMTNAALNLSGGALNANGNFALKDLNFSGGTFNIGAGATTTLTGTTAWSNGNFVGTSVAGSILSMPVGSVVNISGNANHRLDTLTVNNVGTWNNLTSGNTFQLYNGTKFNNLATGVYDFQADGQVGTFGGGGLITNNGLWKKTGGGGIANFAGGVTLDNVGGTISVTSGGLQLNTGGNHSGIATLAGSVQFNSGAHNFTDGTTVNGNLILNGAAASFDNVIINNALNYTAGSASINAGKTLTLGGASAESISGRTIGGTGTLLNQGALTLDNATLSGNLSNQGTLNIGGAANTQVNGATLTLTSGTVNLGAGATLTKNSGALNWNGGILAGSGALATSGGATLVLSGAGARILSGPSISTNNLTLAGGSLTVQSGILNASGTTTISSGTLLDVTGGTFNAGGATVNVGGTFHAGGGVISVGTMNVNTGGFLYGGGAVTGNVINNGTVGPGNSPSTLTINGNYTQGAGGTLAAELGGTTAGGTYDVLDVTGLATIDGALALSLSGGYTGSVGDLYTLINAGTLSGTFSSVRVPAGYTFTPAYFPSQVDVRLDVVGVAFSDGALFSGELVREMERLKPADPDRDKKLEESQADVNPEDLICRP